MTNLDAKVASLIAGNPVPGAASASDAAAGAPPSGEASGSESASGGAETPAASASSTPDATNPHHDLLREKLARVRESRKADRAGERAQAVRAAAQREAAAAAADRQAAAQERARWEGLKDGSYLDGIKALGKDPAQAFAEMQREAIEAGTPEAQIRKMREEWNRQLAETVEPLKRTITDLTEREKRAQAQAAEHGFTGDFQGAVTDEAFASLREEYTDDRLLAHARSFRDDPEALHVHAQRLGVRLTRSDGRFTMLDILRVLKAAQDEHVAGIQSRRAAKTATGTPTEAAPQAAPSSQTVNGTAERRNAGATTLGNGLATERASDGKFIPKGSTVSARLRERVRRLSQG